MAYSIQKNRNPFIDYPGLEEYIWGSKKDTAFSYDNYQEPGNTGVIWVKTKPFDVDTYDLKGQRVKNRLRKGIFIRNQKKQTVVK